MDSDPRGRPLVRHPRLPVVRPHSPSIHPRLTGNTVAAALLGQSMASRDRGKGGGKGGGSGNESDQQWQRDLAAPAE